MNLDKDYDNDGNNIVPCPICLNVHCLSKEDVKCPEEDMFALEGEIRMLLGEYKSTGDNSRIANVLEAVEKLLTQKDVELQKAREEERKIIKLKINYYRRIGVPAEEIVQDIYNSIELKEQSELDQPNK